MPAFALGRVEELLYWIHDLETRRMIPELPVYVDSPMAAAVLETYRSRLDELDTNMAEQTPNGWRAAHRDTCAFCTARLKVISSIPESRAVQESSQPALVISSSGMATGGRVLHHLEHALPDKRNTVLFADFRPRHAGRQAQDGAFTPCTGATSGGRRDQSIDAMSAHADANEIMRWLGGFRAAKLTCLVHGEPARWTCSGAHRARAALERQDAHHLGKSSCLSDTHVSRRTGGGRGRRPDYADGFEALPLDQKVLIWHLRARRWPARYLLRPALPAFARDARGGRRDPRRRGRAEVLAKIRRYAKLFWINSGRTTT
jgi:hypothetical protein